MPSHAYSYSFELNPEWSHRFSPGPEIQAYFEGVADRHGVRERVRFGEEVAATLDLPASAVEVDQAATPGTPVTLWFVADVAESTTESAAPTATVTSSDR